MNNTKTCSMLVGAALLTASSVFASYDGTLTAQAGPYGQIQPYGANTGFYVTTTGDITGTFYTFCIQANVGISTPAAPSQSSTYYYNISGGAKPAGVSYAPTPGASASFDPISIGAAWLYSQFRAGSLAGENTYQGDLNLQWAIWYLEGEKFSISDIGTGLSGADATAYLTAAETALGLSLSGLFNNSNGAYGVVALNNYDANGNPIQNVLAIVPEPSTVVAGALLLLPFGVSTLRILRKKQVS